MNEPIAVRTAISADRDGIWPLARNFATSFTLDCVCFDASFAALLDQPQAQLLVAYPREGSVVGYLLAFVHPTFLANGPVAWIEEIMVDESTRRAGVGRMLMKRAEEWASSVDAAYVALASRRAGEFYAALGYQDSAVYFRKLLQQPNNAAAESAPGR